MFRGTPVSRARYSGFLRNVAVAMGNAGAEKFRAPLETTGAIGRCGGGGACTLGAGANENLKHGLSSWRYFAALRLCEKKNAPFGAAPTADL